MELWILFSERYKPFFKLKYQNSSFLSCPVFKENSFFLIFLGNVKKKLTSEVIICVFIKHNRPLGSTRLAQISEPLLQLINPY